MITTSNKEVENFIIPAYNFYSVGLSSQKSVEEQNKYIKNSTLLTGADSVRLYLSRHIEYKKDMESVQIVFNTILRSPNALSKIDIVSDGSYRCNRMMFNPATGAMQLTGGNLSRLDQTRLGSHMYYGEYSLNERGVLKWIRGNERLFIQESYSFVPQEERSTDDCDDFLMERHNSRNLIIQYVEDKLASGHIPFYSDCSKVLFVSLEEYNNALQLGGYSKYIF